MLPAMLRALKNKLSAHEFVRIYKVPVQVQYAALDAYCLLELLDKWVAAAPPSRHPMYGDVQPAAGGLSSPPSGPAVVQPGGEQHATADGLDTSPADHTDAQRVSQGVRERQDLSGPALPRHQSEGQQPAADLGAGDERGSELRPQSTACADDVTLADGMQLLRLSSAVSQLSAQQLRPSAADIASEEAGGPAVHASRAAGEAESSMPDRRDGVTQHIRAAHGGSAAGVSRESRNAQRHDPAADQAEAGGSTDGGAAASKGAEGREGTWQAAQFWSCRLELLTRSR